MKLNCNARRWLFAAFLVASATPLTGCAAHLARAHPAKTLQGLRDAQPIVIEPGFLKECPQIPDWLQHFLICKAPPPP